MEPRVRCDRLDVDPQWFMNMQSRHDLRIAQDRIDVSGIIPRRAA